MAEGGGGPNRGFAGVALGAGVGDFISVGHNRSDNRKGVGAYVNAGEGGLNLGHVASDAVAGRLAGAVGGAGEVGERAIIELAGFSRASKLVVRVLFKRGGLRTVQRHRAVAIKAELIRGLA